MMKTINKIREITGQVSQKHVGAYAAQSAYFFVLSMIPIILLLLAIIQYTPVTKADVMTAVVNLFSDTKLCIFKNPGIHLYDPVHCSNCDGSGTFCVW